VSSPPPPQKMVPYSLTVLRLVCEVPVGGSGESPCKMALALMDPNPPFRALSSRVLRMPSFRWILFSTGLNFSTAPLAFPPIPVCSCFQFLFFPTPLKICFCRKPPGVPYAGFPSKRERGRFTVVSPLLEWIADPPVFPRDREIFFSDPGYCGLIFPVSPP